MLSVDGNKNLHPEMISLGKQLIAEEFADEINSGRLSVEDAYRNFWSYEEDAKLWGLPEDIKWRVLLPDWEKTILDISGSLEKEKLEEMLEIITKSYFQNESKQTPEKYDPFFDELVFATSIIRLSNSKIEYSSKIIDALENELKNKTRDKGGKPEKLLKMLWDEDNSEQVMAILLANECDLFDEDRPKELISIKKNEDTFRFLMDYISNESNPNKEYAIDALGQIKDKRAVPQIINYLKTDSDLDIDSVVRALDLIDDKSVLPHFLELIYAQSDDEDRGLTKERLFEAIGNIGSEEAVPKILEYLSKKSADVEERSHAISALANIGGKTVIDLLYKCVFEGKYTEYCDNDDPVLHSALSGLVEIGSYESLERLLDYASDPETPKGRYDLWNVVNEYLAQAREEALESMLDYINDPNKRIKGYAIAYVAESISDGIIKISNSLSEKIMNFLISYIDDNNNSDRGWAVEALGDIRDKKAVPALIRYIQDKRNPERHYAVLALGEIDDKAAIPALTEYIQDKRNPERHSVLLAFEKLCDEGTIDILGNYLLGKKNPRSDYAAKILEMIGSEKAVPYLIKYISRPKNKGIEYALHALAKIKSVEAVPELIRYISNPDNPVLEHALFALGQIGSKEAVPHLIRYIENKKNSKKELAVAALGYIDDKNGTKTLISCLSSPDKAVKSTSACALAEKGDEKTIDHVISYIENPLNPDTDKVAIGLLEGNVEKGVLSAINYFSDYSHIEDLIGYLSDDRNEKLISTVRKISENRSEPIINNIFRYIINLNQEAKESSFGQVGHMLELEDAFSALNLFNNDTTADLLLTYLADEKNPDRHYALKGLCKTKSKDKLRQLLPFLLQRKIDYSAYEEIKEVHQHLKPRGYNPPEKRLAA